MSDRRANQFRGSRAGGGKRQAFTLIEVTISVALALFLMLGISEVFRVVGETVGTGQASAAAQRDARASQAVLAADFNSAVTDISPFMILYSQQQWAFRSQADLLGDKDAAANTFDLLGTGTESAQSPALYNYRSHRIDALTFFGRGAFPRQTGADVPTLGLSPFVANMGSAEAMLWYGHLALADNSGSFTTTTSGGTTYSNNTPGIGSTTPGSSSYYSTLNPNNFFASSWILGRQQITLQERSNLDNDNSTLASARIVDQTYPKGTDQYAYMPIAGVNLSPLAYASGAFDSTGGGGTLTTTLNGQATLLSSRIDLAATSILGYRSILSNYITNNTAAGNVPPTWWALLPTGQNSIRFQAQPFFLTAGAPPAKVTPESLAYQAPIFVRGCTQFTVEYAGDYLNQSSTALTTGGQSIIANQGITDTYDHFDTATNSYAAGTTDGQIDFVYVNVPATATNTQTIVRKIRWYGLPRSTTNTLNAAGTQIGINAANGDVVPLRDVLAIAKTSMVLNASPANIPTRAPFEQTLPTTAVSPDYASQLATGMPAGAQYICAWGPNDPKPKMIRITMTIDDPGGRLGDGQTFEYIYTLP